MAKKPRKPARERPILTGGRKRVLVVLFVPSVERDGTTSIDQPHWVDAALEMFGRVFGGATAYPRAKGIWRDSRHLGALGGFCRTMGREARQGEIGLVVGDEYFAIRDFAGE